MTRVGFVGAGRMGAPMVRRLVEAGHEVRALGRSTQRCSAIAALGAVAVATHAEVTTGADVVVICVFTDDQVRSLCLQGDLVAGMDPGTTLILHTTGNPRTAQSIAAAFPHIGVCDAPVSGGPHDIATGTVTVFAGGPDDALERARPVLAAYADPVLHAGPTGSGQLVKLVNNTLFAAQIGLITAGVRLGSALGVSEGALLTALTHGSSQSRALSMIAAAGSAEAFISAVGEFIGKDIAVVRGILADLGADLGDLGALVAAAAP